MISVATPTRWVPAAITVAYASVSAVWIFFSDRLLATIVGDFPQYRSLQTIKGWVFVGMSALALYLALRYLWRQREQAYALLDLTSDMARLGGWRSDFATGKVDATRGIYATYGMTQGHFSADIALGCHKPADREILIAARKNVVVDLQERAAEFAIVALDGTDKWVRVMQRAEIGQDRKVRGVVGAVQDISEIVALRQEAEIQTRLVRNILDNMPDMFFLFDCSLRFTYANGAGLKLFKGANGVDAQCQGRTLWDLFPEFESQLREPLAQLLKDGQSFTRLVVAPSSQAIRWVAAFVAPDGIGMHMRDVTLEVQAQNDLRASEEKFRLASLASQDVLFDWDAVEDRLVWSDAAQHRYGFDPAVFPKTLGDFLGRIHPDDRARVTANAALSLQPGQPDNWTENFRLLNAEGTFAHVLERGLSLRNSDGMAVRVVGTITDVSTLFAEEQRLRAIVDVAADAIYEYDPRKKSVSYSDGIRTTFGHDWVGERPAQTKWRGEVHPEDRARAFASFDAFCDGQDIHWRYEYRMVRADGRLANVREKAFAVRDEQGGLIRVIGSMEDVTEERRAEERMQRAERLQAIGTLTGGVAHDFNNLLTIILGNAELLEVESPDDARVHHLAEVILKAAERGAELTARLLAFSGKQPLTLMAVDIRTALTELERLLERTLSADITLQILCPADCWLVAADPAQMNAAILNLVVNARDAMPGGGTLLIACTDVTLDKAGVETAPDIRGDEYVRITVTDNGTGMDADVVEHAFDPFFTTKSRATGTGLGLSMVHGFIQQSGGLVKITSALGEGTSVSLYLPRSRTEQPESPAELFAPAQVGLGEHVLIVEDNVFLLPHVIEMVTGLGYRVSSAANAQAALDILRDTDDVDVLFTDVVLAGDLNGPALAKLALAVRPNLRALFTSGYTENATIHHGRLGGEVHMLAKPYRRNELAKVLRQVIEEVFKARTS